jgi:hypothetical protein
LIAEGKDVAEEPADEVLRTQLLRLINKLMTVMIEVHIPLCLVCLCGRLRLTSLCSVFICCCTNTWSFWYMFDGRMDGVTWFFRSWEYVFYICKMAVLDWWLYIGYVSCFGLYELNSHADQFDFRKFWYSINDHMWPNKEA